MWGEVYPGDVITDTSQHPTAGLTKSDFTIKVFKNSVCRDSSVTLEETAEDGFYKITLETDNSEGALWAIDIFETNLESYGHYQGSWKARYGIPANVTYQNGVANAAPSDLAFVRAAVNSIKESIMTLARRING